MAHERALANARAIAEGRDPRRRMRQAPTFAQANETVVAIHAEHQKSERTEGQWRASMRDYVPSGSACSNNTLEPSVKFQPASLSRTSILTRAKVSVVSLMPPSRDR